MPSRWETLHVDNDPMKTYVALPEGDGPFPAVVVAQHAGGVDTFIRGICGRLAEAGYVAIAPDQYHRQKEMTFEELAAIPKDDPNRFQTMIGKAQRTRDDEIERDLDAALGHLRTLPEVGDAPVGIIGFCGGGRVSYMMAALNSELRAAGVFYGGAITTPRGPQPATIDLTPRIGCPIIGFFGNDDQNPSPEHVTQIKAALDQHRKSYDFHSYDGTSHAFMDHTGNAYREHSAKDAWPKLLAFLERNLVGVGVGR